MPEEPASGWASGLAPTATVSQTDLSMTGPPAGCARHREIRLPRGTRYRTPLSTVPGAPAERQEALLAVTLKDMGLPAYCAGVSKMDGGCGGCASVPVPSAPARGIVRSRIPAPAI